MAHCKQTARKSTTIITDPTRRSTSQLSNNRIVQPQQQQQQEPQQAEQQQQNNDTSEPPPNDNDQDQTPQNNNMPQQQQQLPPIALPAAPLTAGVALLSQQVVRPDGSRSRSSQSAQRRNNPLASAPRSGSQERDPDWPPSGRPSPARPSPARPRQQPPRTYRGGAVNRPSSRASTSATATAVGNTSTTTTAQPRVGMSLDMSDTTVIEQMQLAFSALDEEVTMLRMDHQRDQDTIINLRSQLDHLSNRLGLLEEELARVDSLSSVRFNELEVRNRSSVAEAGDDYHGANTSIGSLAGTNNANTCLGEAVRRLVLGASGSPACCNCSSSSSQNQTTPKTIG